MVAITSFERTIMEKASDEGEDSNAGQGEAEAEYPMRVLAHIFCDVDLVDKTIFLLFFYH